MEEGRARRGRPPGRIGQPPAGPRDKDLAFPGGPPLWHITPTILDENLQWPQNEVNTQLQLLKLTVESAQEPCLPAAENEHYCLYCLTNKCTRMAVPCGHLLCCKDCMETAVNTLIFYRITVDIESHDRMPLTCLQ